MTNTILWMGGEPESFSYISPGATFTNQYSSTYRSNWCRGYFSVIGGQVLITPYFTPTTSLWMHCQHLHSSTSQGSGRWLMFLGDSAQNYRLGIMSTGTNQVFQIVKTNAAGTQTVLTSAATAVDIATLDALDLQVNYSTTGSITLYKNGISVLSYSGDVTTDGVTQLSIGGFQSSEQYDYEGFSECIIQTTSTFGIGVLTIPVNANGVTQNWTGAASQINGTGTNDSSPLTTTTANTIGEFSVTTTIPTGSWSCYGVGICARLAVGLTGPQHIAPSFLISATNYTDPTTWAPIPYYNNFARMYQKNPVSNSTWLLTDLTNTGFNIGITSES